ncbi:hypothetical protein D3C79_758130 [compost metagenome]
MANLLQGCDRAVAEGLVAVAEQHAQARVINGIADKGRDDPPDQLIEGQPGPTGNRLRADYRQVRRHIQPAIGGRPRQHDFTEVRSHISVAGTDVMHENSPELLRPVRVCHQPG